MTDKEQTPEIDWQVAGPFKVGEVLVMIHADRPV